VLTGWTAQTSIKMKMFCTQVVQDICTGKMDVRWM
jgi:hypothetical protein